jgi:putative hemolysin
LDGYASAVAFATVVIGITFLTLILGELVPKRLALANPEAIAAALSRPLNLMAKIAAPFGWVLNASTNLVLRLLPVSETESPAVTDEEITLMMREGAASGHFHQAESAIVQMALRLGDRRVSAVMTPRTQVDWLDLEDSEEENRAKIRGSSHSRFPVVEGGPDQVVGVVQVKDLLASVMDGGKLDIRAVMRPPLFVPDAIPALRALELLKTSGEPMALVVDEYGDFDGVLTLHDILQALVGDIASQDEEEGPSVVQRADGSWLVDGMISVDEVKDVIGLGRLPEEDSGDFHTLGGFLMARMKRVPKVADQVEVDGYNFEVVDMDGHRVDKVMITPPHLVAED